MTVFLFAGEAIMPSPGRYTRKVLTKEEFYARIKETGVILVSMVGFTSVAQLLTKRTGVEIPVNHSGPIFPKLQPGDKILVFTAENLTGITTGHGVAFSEVEYLGV